MESRETLSRIRSEDEMTTIRKMTVEDYDRLYSLWMKIKGFAMRSIDDSREGVGRFLHRNPDTSVVAERDGNR